MKRLTRTLLLAILIPIIFACRHPIETDPGQSPEISNLQIAPEAVCGSAMITFTLSDPNNDQIDWEAKMNTDVFGDVVQKSGKEASGTTVQDRFKGSTGQAHRHRVKLTITARDDKGNEAQPAEIEFFVFYPC
jgi:PBP1b-binding outer membrane lipoprotein LpoB